MIKNTNQTTELERIAEAMRMIRFYLDAEPADSKFIAKLLMIEACLVDANELIACDEVRWREE